MKLNTTLLVSLGAIATVAASGYWYVFLAGAPQLDPPQVTSHTGLQFQLESFESQAMGSRRQYGIILPPDYDQHPNQRYSVHKLVVNRGVGAVPPHRGKTPAPRSDLRKDCYNFNLAEAIAQTLAMFFTAGAKLRSPINKLTKLGYKIQFYSPPISEQLLKELRIISDEWLHHRHGSEKKFSLGWFDEAYLQNCEIAVVRNPEGAIIAFANTVSEYQRNEVTIDLMRHKAQIENGVMDFLFTSLFQHYQERDYDGFNLGLSALAGVGEAEQSRQLEKRMRYLYAHLNQFYNFKGLHHYKDKFQPRWEPRYLVYPGLASLPDIVIGLVRADSGDRLLDYFKPGSYYSGN